MSFDWESVALYLILFLILSFFALYQDGKKLNESEAARKKAEKELIRLREGVRGEKAWITQLKAMKKLEKEKTDIERQLYNAQTLLQKINSLLRERTLTFNEEKENFQREYEAMNKRVIVAENDAEKAKAELKRRTEISERFFLSWENVQKEKIHIDCLMDFWKHLMYVNQDYPFGQEVCLQDYCKWLLDQVSFFHDKGYFTGDLPLPNDLSLDPDALSYFESFLYHVDNETEESSSYDEFDLEEFTQTAHESVTYFFAEELRKKMVRKAIREMQKDKESIVSGEDSGLLNVWDEICVQVQYEYFICWSAYEDYMSQLVTSIVKKLSWHEIVAIAVNAGNTWDDSINSVLGIEDLFRLAKFPDSFQKEFPIDFFIDIAVDQIIGDLLYEAADYSNSRIEQYLYGGRLIEGD